MGAFRTDQRVKMIKIHNKSKTINPNPDDIFLHFTGNIFGIGCSAFSPSAIDKINTLKQRDKNKSFILLFASINQLLDYNFNILKNKKAFDIINKFSPGNLTVLLEINPSVLNYNQIKNIALNNKIAVRIPKSKLLRDFILKLGHPIISTSINISGNPFCTDINLINKHFAQWFDYGLYDETEEKDTPLPSTLIDITEINENDININCIREGSIPMNKILNKISIFWIAGDRSGDLHAANVLKHINTLADCQHHGIGGELMQKEGLTPLFPFHKFLFMGFVEVIKHIPFILKVEAEIKNFLIKNKPDIVVLVDYPGLNLRIAKLAHKLNIKVFYYICPQFWAWKKYRILKLKKYCVHVAAILPFEVPILQQYNVNCSYVGHPVVEEINFKMTKNEFADKYNLDINKKWIGFFPGSRNSEIKKLLPIFLKTIEKLSILKPDYQFLISTLEKDTPVNFNNIRFTNENYDTMKYCDFLIVKSGTATIETAIIGTPFAIVYKANYITYLIAKLVIKVDFIGLPNLILNKPVVPELIQKQVNPDNIVKTITDFMDNENKDYSMLKQINDILKNFDAAKNTAEGVLQTIKKYETPKT